MWGSNNDGDIEPVCPMAFFCCYLTEILCFRLQFHETVDHGSCGEKKAADVFAEYGKSSDVLGQTNLFRFLSWLVTLGGAFLVLSPLLHHLVWIPLVGTLLEERFYASGLILALIVATLLQSAVACLVWIAYRPLLASWLLLLTVAVGGVLAVGNAMTVL